MSGRRSRQLLHDDSDGETEPTDVEEEEDMQASKRQCTGYGTGIETCGLRSAMPWTRLCSCVGCRTSGYPRGTVKQVKVYNFMVRSSSNVMIEGLNAAVKELGAVPHCAIAADPGACCSTQHTCTAAPMLYTLELSSSPSRT